MEFFLYLLVISGLAWLAYTIWYSAPLAASEYPVAFFGPATFYASATEKNAVVEPAPPPALLSFDRVTKIYPAPDGDVVALQNLSLQFGPGLTALIGPSGCGKSTILRLIGALDAPTNGIVRFQGAALDYGNSRTLRRHRGNDVTFVFQDLNLIPHQTLLENAALPRLCQGHSRAESLAAARRALDVLGIGPLADRLPSTTSGGQQQRAAIARALVSNASILLADEPTGALDPAAATLVMDALQLRAKQPGACVVLVTHNTALAARYADRILRCDATALTDVTAELKPTPPSSDTEKLP